MSAAEKISTWATLSTTHDVRESAALLVELGLAPLELWGLTPELECQCGKCDPSSKSRGKHPCANGWSKKQLEPAALERRLKASPQRNLGLRMGLQPSGKRLVAIDVDGAPDVLLAPLVKLYGELPVTLTARTGSGGAHLIFTIDSELRNSASRLAQHVDVRGEGGQIVCAPSRHYLGGSYEWTEAREPAPLPASWVSAIGALAAPTVPAPVAQLATSRARAYVEKMPAAIAGAGGHGALWNVARKLICDFGLSEADALEILGRDYNPRCQPPWSEAELCHKVSDASRARVRKPVAEHAPRLTFKRGDHVELSQRLASEVAGSGETVFSEGEFYRYGRGIFAPVREAELSRIVQGYAGSTVGRGESARALKLKASDVKGAIKLASDALDTPEFFGGAWPGVAFRDSFVEVTAAGIVEHEPGPEQRARAVYDFPFERGAHPKRFLEFLEQVFRGDDDAQDKIALLQEHLGLSLIGRGTMMQVVPLLMGEGTNGKSTAATILKACFPAGSVQSISPQDLKEDCKKASLSGALLNLVTELPESEIIASEPWKAAVDGSQLSARFLYGQVFNFTPRCGHLYLANRLPGTADHTKGFWRRWVVVPFNRQFSGEEVIRDLDKLIIASERPAITAWLLVGAQRALERGRYTEPPSSSAAIGKWRQASDQVAAFVQEKCEEVPSSMLINERPSASSLYDAYRGWASANGHCPVSHTKFGERLKLLGHPSHRTEEHFVYPIQLRGIAAAKRVA